MMQKAASGQNDLPPPQTWKSWPDLYKMKYPAVYRCKDADGYTLVQ